ncbi:MAG: hypothetical protein EA369_02620 [Bradymonadales bacterium]|nr:MAG: hypothetical protein EA369_02620 [Bradymonadales bacterium]
MIHLLVDAYNLLHQMEKNCRNFPSQRKLPRNPSLEDRRRWMMDLLLEYRNLKEVELTLVFDGAEVASLLPNRTKFGNLIVLFSEETDSADALIARLCAESPGSYYVVSSDLDVQLAAKNHGCTSLRSEEFSQKVFQSLENQAALSSSDDFVEEEDLPLYPRVSTKKRGVARKKPKSERRRRQVLKNL